MVGLGPHLFPDCEDSTGRLSVSAFASSAVKVPGQMLPWQPTWAANGLAEYHAHSSHNTGQE
jgi:hypothetical protein